MFLYLTILLNIMFKDLIISKTRKQQFKNDIIIIESENNKLECCLLKKNDISNLQKLKNNFDFIGFTPNSIEETNMFVNKKINFLINPFTSKKRFFDYNTIRMMKQKNIYGLILFNNFQKLNDTEKMLWLRNAFLFAKFLKYKKVLFYIGSGFNSKQSDTNKYFFIYLYNLFGFSKEQANMFLKSL